MKEFQMKGEMEFQNSDVEFCDRSDTLSDRPDTCRSLLLTEGVSKSDQSGIYPIDQIRFFHYNYYCFLKVFLL